MLKKSCWSFFCIVLLSLSAKSQDSANTINKISISSPTAASLGKYGDIPVSYNTGIPQITVPIYTIKSRSLSLPISLSYHASGLKVQDMASWVGAGWALNAGGMITRTVVGTPDDRGASGNYFTHGHYSDYGFNNYLFENLSTGVTWGTDSAGYTPVDTWFAQGLRDGEPDMFTFNFGGYTGKFYFNDDRTPVLVPEQDFKIQTSYTLGFNLGFTGFIVTVPDGTQYYFGSTGCNDSVKPIEMSVPMTFEDGALTQQQANSSWFLNKIISADATDSIVFKYHTENYSYYTFSMFPVSAYTSGWTTGPSATQGYNLVRNNVKGVRLSQIIFPNGTVIFNTASSPRTDLSGYSAGTVSATQTNTSSFALGSVSVSTTNNYCKQFNFKYGYFHDTQNGLTGPILSNSAFSSINSDTYKLRLDTVQETSCDGSVSLPPYAFSYFSGNVPRSLCMGMDHWGFNNGVHNTSLIPTFFVKFNGEVSKIDGANRDAVFPAMEAGTLQKITYPTGGSTAFDFEANNTYLTYNTYTYTQAKSVTAGYDSHDGYVGDGGGNPVQFPFTFTANTYDLTVSNTSGGKIAQAIIYTSGMSYVNSVTVDPGKTQTITVNLPAGNYYIYFHKSEPAGGNGAYMSLNVYTPTTVSGNVTVGGLRIKTITNNDGVTNKNLVTSYNYNAGGNPTGQSSGILYSRPDYVKYLFNKAWNIRYPPISPATCRTMNTGGNTYYKSPASVRPMETVQGNHIGYNEVKVSQTGNGSSMYRYFGSNYWDYQESDVCRRVLDWDNLCGSNTPQTPAAPVDFEYLRGELKYEGYLNEAGVLVKSVWHYPQFQLSGVITSGHVTIGLPGAFAYTDYFLRSSRRVSDSTVTTLADPNGAGSINTINVTYYASPYHHQPTQKISYSSTGERLTQNISYAFDFLPSTCTSINDGLANYISRLSIDTTLFNDSIYAHHSKSDSCYQILTQFRRRTNLARISYVNYRKSAFSNPVNTYDSTHNAAKSSGSVSADYKAILELQEQFMNPVIESSTWRNNQLIKSGLTLYAYNTNPTGEVYPSLTRQIDLATTSASFTKAVVNTGNAALVTDSRYVDLSSFKFDNGNLVEITGRDGVTTSYIWGLNNTLPIIKAEGASYSTLKTAFIAAGSDPEATRNQGTLSGAHLSTYTYEPAVGITRETDPALKRISYEYDKLFRLVRVRDKNNNILKQYDYQYQTNKTN